MRGKFMLMLLAVMGAWLGPTGLQGAEKYILQPITTHYSVEEPAFQESIGNLLSAPLIGGNKITTLTNGDSFFPAMLEAIRGAQKSICLETFLWEKGKISDAFVEALAERAGAGVRVHLILDDIGCSHFSLKSERLLKKAGVNLVWYNHPHWWKIWQRFNHRTHRKILIVDGKVGFTGGACMVDSWAGNGDKPWLWRDNHYKVEGPVVSQMQSVFMDNWVQSRGQVLHGENYFPVQPQPGTLNAQCFKSGPTEGSEAARLNFLLSIAAARKNIRIAHAYFMPDRLLSQALMEARRRGVKVEVIVPGKIDAVIIKAAARPRWVDLVNEGIEIYEFQPAMYHCKVVIVDDVWTSVGSSNFDDRSLRINDEIGLNVHDRDFAAEQIQIFEADKKLSRPLTSKDLGKRLPWTRARENFWGLFRSQF